MIGYPFKIILKYSLLSISILPNTFLEWIASAVTPLIVLLAKKEVRILEENIFHIYGLPKHSSFAKKFKMQVIHSQIVTALETIKGTQRPNTITYIGLEKLQEIAKNMESYEKGQILITGHIGAWELIAYCMAHSTNKTFYALAKPARSQLITKALEQHRKNMKIKVLWTNKNTFVKEMLTALKEKQWLSFVMDQKPKGRIGPTVSFFDRKVAFVSGPAQMSIRFKAPIISVFCVREGTMKYRFISKEIIPADHSISDEQQLCQIMASQIEEAIKLYPEQWCWNYKRWKYATNDKTS
ncbi:MAG: lysophospholipid acyltransferase family protein [Bdellovibrionota bacterium]